MTVKEFFKSKAFKCILVLLCVLLSSGIILSVAYGFLQVTDEERFARKINAVYDGETVTAEEIEDLGSVTSYDGATIQQVWLIKKKNDYLVQSSSRGYGGDIVCWVAISMNDSLTQISGIRKVIKYSVADSAELISNIGDDVYDKFTTDYVAGKKFTYGTDSSDEYISTGASYSLSAVCNCVNGAVSYITAKCGATASVDPFADLTVPEWVSRSAEETYWSVENDSVVYSVRVNAGVPAAIDCDITVATDTNGEATIVSFSSNAEEQTTESYRDKIAAATKSLNNATIEIIDFYLADDTGVYLNTGATRTNTACYNAAKFALVNYGAIIAKEAN